MNGLFRLLFALGLFQLPGIITVAQQGVKLQVVTPPPPDVSALGKFGLMPVDNFTGVPDISIPVYTIKEGALEFPVSLRYHAGGVKVKEDASEVGLGWALSAGGSVVCVTRGRPDFPGGFSDSYHDMPDPPNMQPTTKMPYYSLNGWFYTWITDFDNMGPAPSGAPPETGWIFSGLNLNHNGVPKEYFNYFEIAYDGLKPDFASDLYIVTIGNRSFKFIFDNNFKPVVLGDGSLKIEVINNGTYPDWKITDESGTTYYFAQRQFYYSSNSPYPNIGGVFDINTWHLSKIVSPTYGEINFNYLFSSNQYTEPLPTASQTYLVGDVTQRTQQVGNVISANYTMYQQSNIESIVFSNGSVKFIYDPVRLDVKGGKRLQTIEVWDKNNRLVKKLVLDNNFYFTTLDNSPGFSSISLSSFPEENLTKRLKLNAVLDVDVTDPTKFRKYSFTYNEQLNLPSKMSLSIDHWGFYNGATNSELVPPTTLILTGEPMPLEFTGANRDAHPDYMQANMLTSIQYPTGGTSGFTYETNRFQRIETVITYHHESSGMFKAAGSSTVNTSGFIDANGNFTVGSNWVGKKLQIESILSNPTYPNNYDMDIIVRRNGLFVKRVSTAPPSGSIVAIDSSIILEEGNYNISYEAATEFYNTFEIRRTVYVLRATSTSEQVTKTVYAGGLRTSRITNVDPVSGNINTKTFSYLNGTADDLPVYESLEGYDPYEIEAGHPFRYRYGQSIYPFSDGGSAPSFGYEIVEVREVDNNNNSNGLSEFYYGIGGSINFNTMIRYNNSLQRPKLVNPIMASIPDIPSGYRGKLITEKHYKLDGGTKVPVSSTTNYYTSDNSTTIWQLLFNAGLSDFLPDGYNKEQEFRIYAHHFPIRVLRNMLRQKESSTYDPTGTVSVTQTEEYTYDNMNGHYQLIKKSTKNSKGDVLNTCYKYPQDYGDLSSVSNLDQQSQGIRLLQQAHVVTPVESYNEEIKYGSTDKQYLGGQINVFNNNLPTLKQVLALETTAPLTAFTSSTVTNGVFSKNSQYTSRIRFTQYDAKGRLLEQKMESDMPHSYIWDYNAMHPIAEVKNGLQSEIAYTSFEADGTGNWSGINASYVQNNGGVTGSKYYNQNGFSISRTVLNASSTYIVSYWTTNNTAYTIGGTHSDWPKKVRSVVINGTTWNYFEHLVSGQSTITVTGSGPVDELRLYPQNAQMTTVTYDLLIGVTSQCDARNAIIYYEYDGLGRLKLIRDQDNNILKSFDYQYQVQP